MTDGGPPAALIEVAVVPASIPELAALLSPERATALLQAADVANRTLAGRTVWNINSTAHGGGVAELLQGLLAYGRGAGVDTRWLVIAGDVDFYALTKRLHNALHGSAGDGGELGPLQRAHYLAVSGANARAAAARVQPGDIVLLHDPQTAGMVAALRERGAVVIWRCHIGADVANAATAAGWEFLRPFIEPADAFVFSRQQYVPAWLPADRVRIIAPSVDPFSTKNEQLTPEEVRAVLWHAGILRGEPGTPVQSVRFKRRDGTIGTMRNLHRLFEGGEQVPATARIVLQISRWDPLKDMAGVLEGFARRLDDLPGDVHLVLAGPDVLGVTDDPEGAATYAACVATWHDLPPGARRRTHLCSLPMEDVDENAHLVNALQTHAAVVVQKSLAEGFGLTVTEPMWKGKPVVASAVGGIQDQIEDGVSGLLLPDPTDLDALGDALVRLLTDPELAATLGAGARERVRDRFLGDRHLIDFVRLFEGVLAGRPVGAAPDVR
jgi:trehalose synthase